MHHTSRLRQGSGSSAARWAVDTAAIRSVGGQIARPRLLEVSDPISAGERIAASARGPRALVTRVGSALSALWFVLRMGPLVILCELLLRVTSTARVARLLGVRLSFDGHEQVMPPMDATDLPDWARRRLRRAIRMVAFVRPNDGCLRQSLIGAVALRPLRPLVRIGVLPLDSEIGAHAWIEVSGRTIFADGDHAPLVDPAIAR